MNFLGDTSSVFNGFDEYGHYLRAQLQITNCVEYSVTPVTGCDAKFNGSPDQRSAGAPPPTPDTLAGKGLPGVTDGDWNADGKVDETDALISGDVIAELKADDAAGAENGTGDLLEFLMGDGK